MNIVVIIIATNISLISAAMFYLIYRIDRSQRGIKYLSLLFLANGIYAIGQFALYNVPVPGWEVFWHKFEHVGIIIILPAWINYVYNYIGKKINFFIYFCNYASLFFLAVLFPTQWIITNDLYFYESKMIQGREGFMYLVLMIVLAGSLFYGYYLLVRQQFKVKLDHAYTLVALFGSGTAMFFGLHDVLTVYGIYIFGFRQTLFEYGLYIMGFSLMYSWFVGIGFHEKKRIKSVFERYISYPAVKDGGIYESNEISTLVNISAVFVDIRGFTQLSEKLRSSEIVSLLNEFYTRIVATAEKYGGVVDKFIGDNVMLVFGVKKGNDNHSRAAVECALEMQDEMLKLNQNRKYNFKIGVGINTGEAIMGNFGPPNRMSYTVLGETINIASALEDLAQAGQIYITGEVWKLTQEIISAEKIGEIPIKYMNNPLVVYNVLGKKSS